jgi:hypothetical protein
MQMAFDRESPDPVWTARVDSIARRVLSRYPGMTVLLVECKTTICKIVATGSSRVQGMPAQWNMQLVSTLTTKEMEEAGDTETGRRATSISHDPSTGAATVYVTRLGYGEPKADGSPNPWPADAGQHVQER